MPLLHLLPTPGGAPAPYHPREFDRLASLLGLRIGEAERSPLFDGIARQGADLFGASAGAVTIVREHDEAFLGNHGMPHDEADREDSICAHTILSSAPFVVEDLRADARFAGMSHVVGSPGFRFYAGAPVFDPTGLPMGTVCVLDRSPRAAGPGELSGLRGLADRAAAALEARRLVVDLLGPNAHPSALQSALGRLGGILDGCLFEPRRALRAAA